MIYVSCGYYHNRSGMFIPQNNNNNNNIIQYNIKNIDSKKNNKIIVNSREYGYIC